MSRTRQHNAFSFPKAYILAGVLFVMLLGSVPASSQNTKGDKPVNNRETRFRQSKKVDKKRKVVTKKRVRPAESSPASGRRGQRAEQSPRGRERATRPIKPVYSKSKPRDTQKPWRGDITRRRIRTKDQSSTNTARNVYPQPSRYVRNIPDRQRPYGGPRGTRVRVQTRTSRTDNIYKMSGRAGFVTKSRPAKTQRPWRGDITGRRIRQKNTSSTVGSRNLYPQHRTLVRKAMQGRDDRSGRSAGNVRAGVRAESAKPKNVFPQSDRYSNKPKSVQRAESNRETLRRVSRMQTSDPKPRKKTRVTARSASGSYIARRSINVYANFPRPKERRGGVTTKDLAGRRLRGKNYETPRPDVIPAMPSYGRKRVGETAGRPLGKYRARTTAGERPWKGDIARRVIRGRDRSSKRSIEGQATLPRTYRSASGRISNRPIPARAPGYRAQLLRKFQSALTGKKRGRLAGSVNRGGWNNEGLPIRGKAPSMRSVETQGVPKKLRVPGKAGFSNQGEEFSGNVKQKGRKTGTRIDRLPANLRVPGKRGFLNQGEEFTGNIKQKSKGKGTGVDRTLPSLRVPPKRGFLDQGEEFSGNIKSRRPAKGGGSVSGKLWNNNRLPIPTRSPGESLRASRFQGNLKARRPEKGGGSISGKLWNNNGTPISTRAPGQSLKAAAFQGNIKAKRQAKGGGSVSGKLWNNNETPIAVRTPSESARRQGRYPGNIKVFELKPGFRNQGEEFTGNVKKGRLKPGFNDQGEEFTGNLKRYQLRPTMRDQGEQFTGYNKLKRSYIQNKNASAKSTLKLSPTKSTKQTGQFTVSVKQSSYKHNPSSARYALNAREPGRAFARSSDYQGNIKMHKFSLFEKNRTLHPDAKFVRTNKNNVDSERDALTNFKLWWARLFRKEEGQPDHLKNKERKPRYDKGEQGLWYE